MKCIALLYSVSDSVLLRSYDEQINIYDSPDEIKHKLERLNAEVLPDDEPEGDDEQQSLSSREKEIVVCVVKGMTNREISLVNFKFIVPAVLRAMRLSISWSN